MWAFSHTPSHLGLCSSRYSEEFEHAIVDATGHRRAVALGECGLDYFGGGGNVDRNLQKKVSTNGLSYGWCLYKDSGLRPAALSAACEGWYPGRTASSLCGERFFRDHEEAPPERAPVRCRTEKNICRGLEAPVRGFSIHVHCFSDSPRFLRAIATDFPNAYFGYAGVVSFVNNRDLQESVRM